MVSGSERRAAVLIVNPSAGRLTPAAREEAARLLQRHFELERVTTTARDAGIEIAQRAVADGADLVIAFGGDGHVNEVVNGIAGTDASLGIVPGGTMNVFARALGIPLDLEGAVEHLARAADRAPRRVPLGRMNDRYFTFSAGCGFDAEAAELVERDLPKKRRMGEVFFYWSALRVLAGSYRHRSPTMVLRGPFGEVPVAMAIASNAGPYAYFAGRPVVLAPDVRLEGSLDVFALRSMRIEALPFYAWRAAVSKDLVHHRDAIYHSDLSGFELVSEEHFARHVDGEPLPPASNVRFAISDEGVAVSA